MRKAVQLYAVFGVLSLLPCQALAQKGWSVQTATTVGTNTNIVQVQAGWPGISATLFHGYTPTVDLGGIFTFNYGYEGDVNVVHPGLKGQFLVRAQLMDTPKYNLGLWFAPGGFVYFFGGGVGTLGGVVFPAGFVFGLPVTHEVNISFNFDLPMFVSFGTFGEFTFPILFGGGVEYFLQPDMALTFNLRMGPMIYTKSSVTDFDLQALFGLAFKL